MVVEGPLGTSNREEFHVAVKISQDQIDDMVAHAREEAPNECCGMVAGRDDVVSRVIRTVNAEASPYRYSLDPADQFRVIKEIEENGEDLIAIYHSHTGSAAYPSQTDINLAFYPDSLYAIVSLEDQSNPDLRVFHIRDGKVEEDRLTILEKS